MTRMSKIRSILDEISLLNQPLKTKNKLTSYPVSLSVCLQPVCLSACSAFTSSLPTVFQSFMKIAGASCAGMERKSAGGRGREVGGESCDKMFSHYPSSIILSFCLLPSSSSSHSVFPQTAFSLHLHLPLHHHTLLFFSRFFFFFFLGRREEEWRVTMATASWLQATCSVVFRERKRERERARRPERESDERLGATETSWIMCDIVVIFYTFVIVN